LAQQVLAVLLDDAAGDDLGIDVVDIAATAAHQALMRIARRQLVTEVTAAAFGAKAWPEHGQ